jgi:metal-responsive CopG/Arc/MetJ family transcriptional regulator
MIMGKTSKIAISLPADLVRKIEKTRKKTGESRSALIRRSLEYTLMREIIDVRALQYIEGYLRHPETTDEKNLTRSLSKKAFEEEPWE